MEPNQSQDALNVMHLELNINDPTVTSYLNTFSETVRQDKAVEALRVGVIAIQSASPSLDTKVVEEKFREVESRINEYISEFQKDIQIKLEEYFKTGSGAVPRSLDSLFGLNGSLTILLNQYFASDNGKVLRLLQEQIGPASQFAKSLDPNNKESVISRLQETVKSHIETQAGKIVEQFSLDKDGSALSRLNGLVSEKVKQIEDANAKYFADLKGALGIKTGREIEAEKGTEKGRDFELVLYDYVAQLGRSLGDSTEIVGNMVGAIERSKKGDFVITLGETSAAPGHRIVIEAKKEQGYKLKDALAELKEAKENREAEVGIFVFAKGYEPSEVGDFMNVGSDFFITVDEGNLSSNLPLLFLDSAYKITRVLIVTAVRKEERKEIDIDRIRREIDSIVQLVNRLSELSTKARTISNNSKFIEETVAELKPEIEARLTEVVKHLG